MDPDDRPGSEAAYARNWRSILLVDASLGLVLAAAGIIVLAVWGNIVGWLLITAGVVYVFAIIGRYRQWRERRARAGLDD
jgi:hypothetical protein